MTLYGVVNDLVWCINKREDKPHKLWTALWCLIDKHGDETDEDTAVALGILDSLMKGEETWPAPERKDENG